MTEVKLTAKQSRLDDKIYYVYQLIDPRDNVVFYIGKGKGNRISSHVKSYMAGKIDNVHKHRKIKEIIECGFIVTEQIIHNNLSEKDAYRIERELISINKGNAITNIKGGVVTNKELQYESVCNLLRRLKPYDEWVKSIDDEIHGHCIRMYGSLLDCYMKMYNDLMMLKGHYANS
jgi:hypothetical protein